MGNCLKTSRQNSSVPMGTSKTCSLYRVISFGTTLLASVADGTQPVPQPTQGFLTDLLTDGVAPSFHRYQMVLFTVILAIIFIAKTATNLVMPEFDTTLLGLMGISNGTYLGFKLQGR